MQHSWEGVSSSFGFPPISKFPIFFFFFFSKMKILQCKTDPILMYGCKAWTKYKTIQKKVEAVEILFRKRMLKIPWSAKKANQDIMREQEQPSN